MPTSHTQNKDRELKKKKSLKYSDFKSSPAQIHMSDVTE